MKNRISPFLMFFYEKNIRLGLLYCSVTIYVTAQFDLEKVSLSIDIWRSKRSRIMKKIVWELHYLSLPPVLRYCKKCGRKTEFFCSGQFRVNAQRKYLDIWLIYKCFNCDTTWNAAIDSRIAPQSLAQERLEGFHNNDRTLVKQYAMNIDFLHRNGAEVRIPTYSIEGDSFLLGESVELEIKSEYPFPIKISSLVREKLHLSQKEYFKWIADGKIKSIPEQDLGKCRLNNGIILVFSNSC